MQFAQTENKKQGQDTLLRCNTTLAVHQQKAKAMNSCLILPRSRMLLLLKQGQVGG